RDQAGLLYAFASCPLLGRKRPLEFRRNPKPETFAGLWSLHDGDRAGHSIHWLTLQVGRVVDRAGELAGLRLARVGARAGADLVVACACRGEREMAVRADRRVSRGLEHADAELGLRGRAGTVAHADGPSAEDAPAVAPR